MIVYQDDVTELDRANACTAGPSTKSIDTIASVITQPSKHTGIDIGLHVGSAISDDLKMELLDSAWAPSADFVMPHSTRTLNGKEEKRYLRHEHLKRYPFLSYSPSMQGLYCRPCVLFGPPSGEAGRGNQKLSALVIKPLTYSVNITDCLVKVGTCPHTKTLSTTRQLLSKLLSLGTK